MPGVSDWFFLAEVIGQLEVGVREACPEYQGRWWEQILVLGTQFPYWTYVVASFLFVYERTVTSAAIIQGMFLNGLTIWLAAFGLEKSMAPIDAGCGHFRSLRPAAACGIMWFVVFFLQLYEAFNRGACCSCMSLSYGRTVILLLAVVSSMAQSMLRLFHPFEVLIAVALAFVSAVIASLVLHKLVIPSMQNDCLRTISRWFCISLDHPRYAPREGYCLAPLPPPPADAEAERAKLLNGAYARNFTSAGILRSGVQRNASGGGPSRVVRAFDTEEDESPD